MLCKDTLQHPSLASCRICIKGSAEDRTGSYFRTFPFFSFRLSPQSPSPPVLCILSSHTYSLHACSNAHMSGRRSSCSSPTLSIHLPSLASLALSPKTSSVLCPSAPVSHRVSYSVYGKCIVLCTLMSKTYGCHRSCVLLFFLLQIYSTFSISKAARGCQFLKVSIRL